MKVVLQDVVREVSKATKLALPDAQVVVRKLVSTLEQGILSGQRIEIRGFGVFQTKTVQGKKGRDMARNLSISLPAYQKVSFKAGKHWKRRSKAPLEEPQPAAAGGQLEMPIFQEVVNR
ncbi:MAG TPA: HU family DNA-binding protein [bacterium]|nr:HU family DNA-binding protein [bacterium]